MRPVQLIRVAAMAAAASVFLAASSVGQSGNPAPTLVEATIYTPPPEQPVASERLRLRDGMAAAESGDWGALAQLRDSAADPLVRRMLQWRWAASTDAPLYFADIALALN